MTCHMWFQESWRWELLLRWVGSYGHANPGLQCGRGKAQTRWFHCGDDDKKMVVAAAMVMDGIDDNAGGGVNDENNDELWWWWWLWQWK